MSYNNSFLVSLVSLESCQLSSKFLFHDVLGWTVALAELVVMWFPYFWPEKKKAAFTRVFLPLGKFHDHIVLCSCQ